MKGVLPRLLMFVLAVGFGMYCTRDVWQKYSEQRRDADRARAEMRQAEDQESKLRRDKAFLESKAGREKTARDHLFLGPGDHPL